MKKEQNDFIFIEKTFAIFPRKTEDQGWKWLNKLWVVRDCRPVEYLGLLEENTYFVSEAEAKIFYNKILYK